MSIIQSVIQPRRPTGPGWRQIHDRATNASMSRLGSAAFAVWAHDEHGLGVISAVEVAEEIGATEVLGPQYHLSVSAFGQRCTSADALWVLAQFDLVDAKEDNHVPSGRVRNFWRPVADRLSGYECPCADSEPAIREDKGDFVWRAVPRGAEA